MTEVTKTATITSVGLEHMAKIVADESDSAIKTLGVGSGTTAASSSDTGLNTEITGNGFAKTEGACSFVSPNILKIVNRFTASGADVTVREFGVFSEDGTLIARCTIGINELPDDCSIPTGEDLEVTAAFSFIDISGGNPSDFENTLAVSCLITLNTDPGEYACSEKICFNGIGLKNASVTSISEIRGRKTWDIECYTLDYDDIDAISVYATSVSSGVTVTGHQWASSILCSGTLRIWDSTTRALVSYPNCYIQSPVGVTAFGDGHYYTVKVIESYEAI